MSTSICTYIVLMSVILCLFYSGIIEYCKPGTCPGWFNMSAGDW